MSAIFERTDRTFAWGLPFQIAVAALLVLSVIFLASPADAATAGPRVTPANGSTQQWAFGGVASSSYSCSNSNCFGGNFTINGTFSLSWHYYIEWVVIYTQTNVSATQTMVEGQAALNASASLSLSECVVTAGSGGPCTTTSASATVSGRETATGFTNITNGSVVLTRSLVSPLGSTPAQAIQNAVSNESFNFSGSYSLTAPIGTGGTVQSATVNFDIGGTEASSVNFPAPLGVVPLDPHPGDAWTSSAPFTAHGAWTSGYSLSVSGYAGGAASQSNWTSGSVSPSGTLQLNGSDLGQSSLYDNYTNPVTTTTVQDILLVFGTGAFSATDGWVMVPTGLYRGITHGLFGVAVGRGMSAPVSHPGPAATGIGSITSGESAYYQRGAGFVGASAGGNASIPIAPGANSPSISLSAGPEPVSVAEQQYKAITSNPPASSSNPAWLWVAVGVAVALLVVIGALLFMRRSRRRPGSSMGPSGGSPSVAGQGPAGPQSGAPSGGPTGPMAGAAPQAAGSAAGAAPTCLTCGQPATFVPEYNRYYCYTDRTYV